MKCIFISLTKHFCLSGLCLLFSAQVWMYACVCVCVFVWVCHCVSASGIWKIKLNLLSVKTRSTFSCKSINFCVLWSCTNCARLRIRNVAICILLSVWASVCVCAFQLTILIEYLCSHCATICFAVCHFSVSSGFLLLKYRMEFMGMQYTMEFIAIICWWMLICCLSFWQETLNYFKISSNIYPSSPLLPFSGHCTTVGFAEHHHFSWCCLRTA